MTEKRIAQYRELNVAPQCKSLPATASARRGRVTTGFAATMKISTVDRYHSEFNKDSAVSRSAKRFLSRNKRVSSLRASSFCPSLIKASAR